MNINTEEEKEEMPQVRLFQISYLKALLNTQITDFLTLL